MPKQSAKDELIARIDADDAKWTEMREYIKAFSGDTAAKDLIAALDRNISHVQSIKNYVSADAPTPADKPKRTRGKGKRGLPTTANVDGV